MSSLRVTIQEVPTNSENRNQHSPNLTHLQASTSNLGPSPSSETPIFLNRQALSKSFRQAHFLNNHPRRHTLPRTNTIRQEFQDYLSLYESFGGDEYPEDESDFDDFLGKDGMDDEEENNNGEDDPLLFGQNVDSFVTGASRSYSSIEISSQHPKTLATGTAGVKKVVFLLLKSFIGTGVLFLPRSFHHGGMLFSAIVLCLVALLCLYCMLLLLECRSKVPGSFGDIGGSVYGPRMKDAVLISITISQIGVCCAYTIFVATTMQDLIMLLSECEMVVPLTYLVFFQLLVYAPLAMIRKIKHLSSAALIADFFIFFGICYLYYYDFYILSTKGPADYIPLVNTKEMTLFIGTAIFTFEGIGLVIPIAESMAQPKKFPKVLSYTTLFVLAVFLSVGGISYAAFGEKVQTVVLLNLPTGDPIVIAVQFLYTLAIVFSVPLQLFPAIGIVELRILFPPETTLSGKLDPIVKWQKNSFRILTAIFVGMISWVGVNSLDRLVSLIGSFACIPLSFIYPAMFHYRLVAESKKQRFVDLSIAVLGVVMMIFVTAQTISSWNDQAKPPPTRCDYYSNKI